MGRYDEHTHEIQFGLPLALNHLKTVTCMSLSYVISGKPDMSHGFVKVVTKDPMEVHTNFQPKLPHG